MLLAKLTALVGVALFIGARSASSVAMPRRSAPCSCSSPPASARSSSRVGPRARGWPRQARGRGRGSGHRPGAAHPGPRRSVPARPRHHSAGSARPRTSRRVPSAAFSSLMAVSTASHSTASVSTSPPPATGAWTGPVTGGATGRRGPPADPPSAPARRSPSSTRSPPRATRARPASTTAGCSTASSSTSDLLEGPSEEAERTGGRGWRGRAPSGRRRRVAVGQGVGDSSSSSPAKRPRQRRPMRAEARPRRRTGRRAAMVVTSASRTSRAGCLRPGAGARVVVVVLGREAPPTAGEGAQLDGVAQQLALGDEGVDHLLAGVARLGALHPAAASTWVTASRQTHSPSGGRSRCTLRSVLMKMKRLQSSGALTPLPPSAATSTR